MKKHSIHLCGAEVDQIKVLVLQAYCSSLPALIPENCACAGKEREKGIRCAALSRVKGVSAIKQDSRM
ncbi:hypothetical protein ACER0C_008323 [Sarotherodon galilaeus]